ncbi:hypothetical protein NLU13_6515 [Sarocladium strictum]|uniref:DUF159 domain protein n=1 Tax=Sarocladium strictum TaxID=5046 RepID=A0AA39GG19_SARSR|nr:hypothetical protein NLU13_6515 [Sarocladium strictum]
MCGRYALNLSPSQVRDMLMRDDMPIDDLPQDEGPGAPRQSYNFAPGYHGLVFRADTPDWGAGPRHRGHGDDNVVHDAPEEGSKDEVQAKAHHVSYKLQSMKWGLIPFWTKRNPDYASMMKTINCRDDSLAAGGGMWNTMKARKRCIIIAEGFYEWLKMGPKDKLPHHIRRKDRQLMCFAGLWDCVQYEGSDDKLFTYTIITTDSNKQLKFLHDRMPVILDPGSDALKKWLDPSRHEWSRELQSLLKPFEGELEVYPVSKEVGKVGNNSPSFVIPVNSKENKSNIANFFTNASTQTRGGNGTAPMETRSSPYNSHSATTKGKDTGGVGALVKHAPQTSNDLKRKASDSGSGDAPSAKKISSTQNTSRRSPQKAGEIGTPKITSFFNSA